MAAFAVAVPAAALTIPLNQKSISTSIEGTPVKLFITGPLTMDLSTTNVAFRIDAVVDLREVQKKFAPIVLARAVTRDCGDSITLRNATVQPEKSGNVTFAVVVANATIHRVSCDADRKPSAPPVDVSGVLALRLQAKADAHERLAFDITPTSSTSAAIAKLLADRSLYDALAGMVSGTLNAAAGTASVTAAVNREAASYDPRVKLAAFEALPGGVLGANRRPREIAPKELRDVRADERPRLGDSKERLRRDEPICARPTVRRQAR